MPCKMSTAVKEDRFQTVLCIYAAALTSAKAFHSLSILNTGLNLPPKCQHGNSRMEQCHKQVRLIGQQRVAEIFDFCGNPICWEACAIPAQTLPGHPKVMNGRSTSARHIPWEVNNTWLLVTACSLQLGWGGVSYHHRLLPWNQPKPNLLSHFQTLNTKTVHGMLIYILFSHSSLFYKRSYIF